MKDGQRIKAFPGSVSLNLSRTVVVAMKMDGVLMDGVPMDGVLMDGVPMDGTNLSQQQPPQQFTSIHRGQRLRGM